MSQRNEVFRTQQDLDEAQGALLAWSMVGDGDERLNRLRDHTIALCTSLRRALGDRDALIQAARAVLYALPSVPESETLREVLRKVEP